MAQTDLGTCTCVMEMMGILGSLPPSVYRQSSAPPVVPLVHVEYGIENSVNIQNVTVSYHRSTLHETDGTIYSGGSVAPIPAEVPLFLASF